MGGSGCAIAPMRRQSRRTLSQNLAPRGISDSASLKQRSCATLPRPWHAARPALCGIYRLRCCGESPAACGHVRSETRVPRRRSPFLRSAAKLADAGAPPARDVPPRACDVARRYGSCPCVPPFRSSFVRAATKAIPPRPRLRQRRTRTPPGPRRREGSRLFGRYRSVASVADANLAECWSCAGIPDCRVVGRVPLLSSRSGARHGSARVWPKTGSTALLTWARFVELHHHEGNVSDGASDADPSLAGLIQIKAVAGQGVFDVCRLNRARAARKRVCRRKARGKFAPV